MPFRALLVKFQKMFEGVKPHTFLDNVVDIHDAQYRQQIVEEFTPNLRFHQPPAGKNDSIFLTDLPHAGPKVINNGTTSLFTCIPFYTNTDASTGSVVHLSNYRDAVQYARAAQDDEEEPNPSTRVLIVAFPGQETAGKISGEPTEVSTDNYDGESTDLPYITEVVDNIIPTRLVKPKCGAVTRRALTLDETARCPTSVEATGIYLTSVVRGNVTTMPYDLFKEATKGSLKEYSVIWDQVGVELNCKDEILYKRYMDQLSQTTALVIPSVEFSLLMHDKSRYYELKELKKHIVPFRICEGKKKTTYRQQ